MADRSDRPPGPVLVWEELYYWDRLDSRWVSDVDRAKIPGGWLVKRNAVSFVPDPEHRWDGSSLP